jgi:ubiquitin-conjugating enzyme E2 O
LRLDGTAEVTHPNSTISVYPLERLTKLYDGIEQLEDDGWAGDTSDDDESVDENGDGIWLKDGEGVWRYRLDDADGNEWQETDKDEDGPDDGDEDDAMDLEDDAMDVDDDFGTDFMTVSSHPDTPPPPLDPISTVAPFSVVQKIFNDAEGPVSNSNMDQESNTAGARDDLSPWKRFDILGSAPHDHAFYATAPSQPSKNFLGRLTKEYRVLLSSLPGVY